MAEVGTLGECLTSFVASTPGPLAQALVFDRHVAGAEANVAVGLARLGHAAVYIGHVGADSFGTAIVRRLRGEGVDGDLETALRMGNACGALAVAAAGDQAGLPDRFELGRLLAGGGPDTIR